MQRNRSWIWQALSCGLLALALSACGAGSHATSINVVVPQAEPQANQSAPLPSAQRPLSLPAPSQLASHGASFTLAEGFANGKDFDALKPNNRASIAVNDCVLAPSFTAGSTDSAAGLAYATYDFHLPSYGNGLADIAFNWTDHPLPGSWYVALGDFTTDSWKWFSNPALDALNFANIAQYINAADHCYLVVATTGTDASILTSIQISEQQAPVADLISDVDSGVPPLTVTFDASASTDADGTITDVEWDFNGDNNFFGTIEEQGAIGDLTPLPVTYSVVGVYNVQVRITDDDGLTDTAQLQINVTASPPPVADLAAPVTSGPKPLSVDFDATGSTDDGTITDFEWDFNGNGAFNEAGAEQAAKGDSTPPTVIYPAVASLNAAVRVTDNDNGSDIATLAIQVTNSPPVADLQADFTQGNAPLGVTFDATGSSDPGGTIVDYEWDFDGDGNFNEPGEEADSRNIPTPLLQTYPAPGVVNVGLRVTDDNTAVDATTLQITVHGWVVITVDDDLATQEGYNVNLILQSGLPVIGHCTLNGYGFRLARSSTAEGANAADWTGALAIDGTLFSPTHCSLAIINQNPAVTFFNDGGVNGLYYSRSITKSGMSSSDWITPIAVDTTDTAGLTSVLLEVAGFPSIGYNAPTAGDVRYARSTQADGSSGWSHFTVAGDGAGAQNFGQQVDMAILSGYPAMAYSSSTAGMIGLRYSRSFTPSGSLVTDWTLNGVNVTAFGDGGQDTYPSLILVNGNPAVSFMDNAGVLRYARSGNATGSMVPWAACTPDNTGITGEYSSMALINGYPSIAYYSQTASLPRFVSSTNTDGNGDATWTNEQNIVGGGSNGRFTAMVELSTLRPGVAYRDDGNHKLKYCVLY